MCIRDREYAEAFSCEDAFRAAALEIVGQICRAAPPYAPLLNALNRFCLSLEGLEEPGSRTQPAAEGADEMCIRDMFYSWRWASTPSFFTPT